VVLGDPRRPGGTRSYWLGLDFDPADFERRWFDPTEGIAAVRRLLDHPSSKARRLLTERVRAELDLVRQTLEAASRLGSTFYLVEAYAHESRRFAGPDVLAGSSVAIPVVSAGLGVARSRARATG